MKYTFIKDIKEVSRQRAKDAMDLKYKDKIINLKKRFFEKKDPRLGSELYKLQKRSLVYREEMYNHFLSNFEIADDCFVKEEDRAREVKSGGIKSATDILIKSLEDMEF